MSSRNDARRHFLGLVVVCLLGVGAVGRASDQAAPAPAADRLQAALDAWREEAGVPGVTVGIALPDGTDIALASGVADRAAGTAMRADDLMLAGSTGKTFFAAVAAQLAADGALDLDAPIARYLGDRTWLRRIAHADAITVRHLMTHTSGLVRYEMKPEFTSQLVAAPDRTWTPEDEVAFLLDEPAPFAPGEGWEYSDTNYIVLGMILEEVLDARLYDEVARRFLEPLGLRGIVPSTSRRIPGLVAGYAGPNDPLGLPDEVLVDGQFVINPQFEWTGGGYATSAPDLARWGRALYRGDALTPEARRLMIDAAVPARLGPETRYGLGVIVRAGTPVGETWGHSGFFPGYVSELVHVVESGVTLAVQVNSSARRAPGSRSPLRLLFDLAGALDAGQAGQRVQPTRGAQAAPPPPRRPIPPGATATRSSTQPVSPSVMASWVARRRGDAPHSMELVVLWRGEPGWFVGPGGGGSSGGGSSGPGGTGARYSSTVVHGGVRLTYVLDFDDRIVTVQGQRLELGDDNVVLVDFVDSDDGPTIVGTTRVDPLALPDDGRPDLGPTLRSAPDLLPFLRCDVSGDDRRLAYLATICARLSGGG